jgi:hypothetical protein
MNAVFCSDYLHTSKTWYAVVEQEVTTVFHRSKNRSDTLLALTWSVGGHVHICISDFGEPLLVHQLQAHTTRMSETKVSIATCILRIDMSLLIGSGISMLTT